MTRRAKRSGRIAASWRERLGGSTVSGSSAPGGRPSATLVNGSPVWRSTIASSRSRASAASSGGPVMRACSP